MGSNHFENKYQKVPSEIGMSIPIAIGFVFLILSGAPGGPSQNKKNEKNKANGNGNAHANFDWHFLVLFFQNGLTPSSKPHLAFSKSASVSFLILSL